MTPIKPRLRGPQARHSAIVSRIKDAANHGGSFGIFFTDKAIMAELDTIVDFSQPIADADRREIIRRSVVDVIITKAIEADRLVTALREREKQYLAQPLTPYLVATSVTLPRPKKAIRWRVGGTQVAIVGAHSKRIIAARRETLPPIEDADLAPQGSAAVQIRVRARSPGDAIHRAMETFDLLRSCWNFAVNSRVAGTSWVADAPINTISVGRVHTVHEPSGKLAFETYFFQQGAPLPTWALSERQKFNDLHGAERVMRRRLAHVPYRPELEGLLLRYVRALDSIDYSWAFVQLWGLLERLTATGDGRTAHIDTVDRASFVWDEPAIAHATLDHLRERRNGLVHHGRESDASHTLVYQTKRYVEALIDWHLRNRGKFATLAEVGAYLSLPSDPSKLKGLLALYRRAHTFRTAVEPETPEQPQPVPTS